jgi:hypothetical protein
MSWSRGRGGSDEIHGGGRGGSDWIYGGGQGSSDEVHGAGGGSCDSDEVHVGGRGGRDWIYGGGRVGCCRIHGGGGEGLTGSMAGGGGAGCDGIYGGGRGCPDGIHFRCPATATCCEAGGSGVPLREGCVPASGGTVDPVRVLFILLHLSCARVYFPSSTVFLDVQYAVCVLLFLLAKEQIMRF